MSVVFNSTGTIDALVKRRRSHSSGSGFVVGVPGSGCSTTAQLQIFSILDQTEDDVVVIDTNGFYRALGDRVDVQIIKMGPCGDNHINLFDLPIGFQSKSPRELILEKTSMLLPAFEHLVGLPNGLSVDQRSHLFNCITEAYAPYFENKIKFTGEYDPGLLPVLRDLYRILRTKRNDDCELLAQSLVPLLFGCNDMFAHPTNVHHKKRLVVYDLLDVKGIWKEFAILAILGHVWNKTQMNIQTPKRVWIFMDNISRLLESEYSLQYLCVLMKKSRAHGCILTGIASSAEPFFRNENRPSLPPHCEYIHLLRLSSVDMKKFAKALNLLPSHVDFLSKGETYRSLIYEGEQLIEASRSFTEETLYYPDVRTGTWKMRRIRTSSEDAPYWEPRLNGTYWCSECHQYAEHDRLTGKPILEEACPSCGAAMKPRTAGNLPDDLNEA